MADRRPAGRPTGGKPRVDPARDAAYAVLKAVRVDGAYANLVLPTVLAEHGLSGRDAALTTELAAGTLRGLGTYDAILEACTDKPLARTPAKVLDALRLGAHQVLAMRVPDHAAISTTVDLVRARANPGSAGFANAVLRKVAASSREEWLERVAPLPEGGEASDEVLGVRHSHPTWVVTALRESLAATGDDGTAHDLSELLAADNEAPTVTLAARPGRVDRAALPGTPTRFSPYGVALDGGDPGELADVRQGRAGVQDEGSQLVAHALVEAPLEGRDERWLDVCAGPGGKTALLAALAEQRGAVVVGNEAQHHRTLLVRGALRGTVGAGRLVTGDGTRPPWAPGTFDRVLVDAPCSGLGALRRRPESRWRRTPADVADLVDLQRDLLARAVDAVRPGGVVLYATCSPVLEETAAVVRGLLDGRDDVALVPDPLPDVPDAAGPLPGTAQLWPHRHGTDAMFLALLRRAP